MRGDLASLSELSEKKHWGVLTRRRDNMEVYAECEISEVNRGDFSHECLLISSADDGHRETIDETILHSLSVAATVCEILGWFASGAVVHPFDSALLDADS